MKLNLGCGRNPIDGYVNIDSWAGPGVDAVINLEPDPTAGDYQDRVFDLATRIGQGLGVGVGELAIEEVFASHFLEHIKGHLALMDALWLFAQPGCKATFLTPHGASDDAFEDPTHVRPMFPFTYAYFAQPTYWRADYGYRGDWALRHVVLDVPHTLTRMPEVQLAQKIRRERNVVVQMAVVLEAIKPLRPALRPAIGEEDQVELTYRGV